MNGRFAAMTMQLPQLFPVGERRAKRAAEAYRMADRLGRPQRASDEWRRLCRADKTRQSFYAFEDMIDPEDAEFEDVESKDLQPDPDPVRVAYFVAAVAAGTLSLVMGAAFLV